MLPTATSTSSRSGSPVSSFSFSFTFLHIKVQSVTSSKLAVLYYSYSFYQLLLTYFLLLLYRVSHDPVASSLASEWRGRGGRPAVAPPPAPRLLLPPSP